MLNDSPPFMRFNEMLCLVLQTIALQIIVLQTIALQTIALQTIALQTMFAPIES